jgi:hypothetical protein
VKREEGVAISAPGITTPLYLSGPIVRYLEDHQTPVSGRGSVSGKRWAAAPGLGWTLDDDRLSFQVLVQPTADGRGRSCKLSLSATANRPVRVGWCALEFMSPCEEQPFYIDRFLRWSPLRGAKDLNDYGQFLVRWRNRDGATTELRSPRGSLSSRLSWERNQLRVSVHMDAAALHPRWLFSSRGEVSTAAPPWVPGRSVGVELVLSLIASGSSMAPTIISRFPGGAEAAFAITDHCDFDDVGRLQTFLYGDGRGNGWLDSGLRMTKGVFALASSPPHGPPVPCLQDPEYRKLIGTMHQKGNEVVPHALSEWGNIPPEPFHSALNEFKVQWSSTTWIDHGNTLNYCYSMGGAADPSYALLDSLRGNGFTGLWSYQDTPADACSSLNTIAPARRDLNAMGSHLVLHLLRGEILVAMHYLRSIMRRILRGEHRRVAIHVMSAVRSLWMHWRRTGTISFSEIGAARLRIFDAIRKGFRGESQTSAPPYTRQEVIIVAPLVYPERGVPLIQTRENELMLFTTTEALHLRDVYSKKALDHLLTERGLHFGHCYILNQLPYIAGIFERGVHPCRLTEEWTRFLGVLKEAVRAGRIWNPTAGELVEWVVASQAVACIPEGDGRMRIENPFSKTVRDFTFLFPRSVSPEHVLWPDGKKVRWRYWQDWLAVWGELQGKSQSVLRWN